MTNSIILLSIFGVITFGVVVGEAKDLPVQFQKRSISDNEGEYESQIGYSAFYDEQDNTKDKIVNVWAYLFLRSLFFLENVNCKDLSTCDSVTQQMCTALPSLRANCPRKCQVEECLFTCEDTPECPENVLPAVCGLLSNDDKHKCNQTCGLCEEVTIQGKIIHLNYQWQRKNYQI